MLDALERLYMATDEDNFEALDQATTLLGEAHMLIEYSFALADQIDTETEEILADSISHQLA